MVATTHYPELKAYGYNRDGVINASVEFDITTLSPTYKLLIGVPGRSNAFEISKRLGLQENVIQKARSQMSDESNEVDTMIASLESSKKTAEIELMESKKSGMKQKNFIRSFKDRSLNSMNNVMPFLKKRNERLQKN